MVQKIKNLSLAAIPFVFILLCWIVVSNFGWLPAWLLPTPQKTLMVFWDLLRDGTIAKIVWISIINSIPPYLLAIFSAIFLGVIIGVNKTIRQIFFPFISTIYPIPTLAWLPLIILLTGFTRQSIWVLVFLSSFMKMIFNMISGVRNVNPNLILAAKNLGLNKVQIIIKVIIPSSFPHIITGLRMGFGSCWRSLISAEMLVTSVGGLGKFIWMSQWTFDFERVIIGIALIAIIGLGVELLVFKKLETATLKAWGLVED